MVLMAWCNLLVTSTLLCSCVVFWGLRCIAQTEFAEQQTEIWYAASSGPCSFLEVDFIYQKLDTAAVE